MENIYLKAITEKDVNLLIEYNNDFKKHFPDIKFYINENNFYNWYSKAKNSQSQDNSIHLFPFWMMKNNKAIGLPILKTNIEADKTFNKYGGHISYVIAPSYRKKGYGTKCLHLALEKCKELGLKEVMVACDIRNIGSKKVIENNYSFLKDIVVQNIDDKYHHGNLEYRYFIDIEKSLKQYKEKKEITRPLLKQICKLNRENLDDFLINVNQNEVGEETLKFSKLIKEINSIQDIANLYQTFIKEFKQDKKVEKFKRTTEEIIKSKICSGCNDAGLVLSTILRLKDIPTIFVSSGHIEWIKNLQNKNETAKTVKGHIFLEIYLNDKWYLFDSMNGYIYDNYDYNNLSLPNGYYAFRKTLNNHNFGAYTLEDNNKIMIETFKNFNLKNYEKPNYKTINLK